MTIRWFAAGMLVAVLVGYVAGTGLSDEEDAPRTKEAAARADAPGPMHQQLDALAGEWKAEGTWWDDQGNATKTSGTSTNTWILGDRFLKMHYEGRSGQGPYKGLNLLGYDNAQGEFQSVWASTMSTGIEWAQGRLSEDKDQLVLVAVVKGPRGTYEHRYVYDIQSPDEYVVTAFQKSANAADETKTMEVVFTSADGAAERPDEREPMDADAPSTPNPRGAEDGDEKSCGGGSCG